MTNTWIYVCELDSERKQRYYISRVDPESVFRDPDGMWDSNESCWWYEIDPSTKKVKYDAELNLEKPEMAGAALMLDLSNIPMPTEDDSKPIIVVQKINQSINYYTLEE